MTTLEFRTDELKVEASDALKATRAPGVFLFRVLAMVAAGLAVVVLMT